ncbi:MAG: hypothetical protein EPN88_14895 [Bacteroidetes bacterium]|nr:MAG: hypothetical protein EPN88_14895 [Bacteroidota bacterium]
MPRIRSMNWGRANIFIIVLIFFLIGCTSISKDAGRNFGASGGATGKQISDSSSHDPIIQRAEPYLSKIILEDASLRSRASSIAYDCPSGNKDCQVNSIYMSVVQNFKYFNDPRNTEYIQAPQETINVQGGDCEDLTIYLNSLLENIGIKTYLVLTDSHAYSLACGMDMDDLSQYIEDDIVKQLGEELTSETNFKIQKQNGYYYLVSEKTQKISINPRRLIYLGGDGSKISSPFLFLKLDYKISTDVPVDIRIVPNEYEFNNYASGKQYMHYQSCQENGVFETSDSCKISERGGIVISNPESSRSATVEYTITNSYALSIYDIAQQAKIVHYNINGQTCVILDPTLGKYGYPAYDTNIVGKKTAIDPVTKEYVFLN